jgi:hypothetical protein
MTDEAPFCECGCGERVRTRKRGAWARYRRGHNMRALHVDPGPAPYCECGCGERVRSHVSGVWSRWRPGHQIHNRAKAMTLVATGEVQTSMFPDIVPDKPITKRVER